MVLGDNEQKASPNQNLMFYLTLRHGIRTVEGRLLWCDEAAKALAQTKRRASRQRRHS